MIEQVFDCPKIYRIPVNLPQNPLQTLNAYVICTKERNLIIDTGFNRPECRNSLWAGLQELNLDLSKSALFLTHLHSDHTGLVQDFTARQIPVYMGRADCEYYAAITAGLVWPVLEDRYRLEGYPSQELALQSDGNHARLYGPKGLYPVTPLDDRQTLHLGNVIMQVIHTPGHTPGHMTLYLPREQVLFSGDHVLFDITPNIGVWVGVKDSLTNYLTSLEKIRILPVKHTFPGHRGQKGNLYQRIDSLIRHHRQRLEEISTAVRAAPGSTAYQLAGSITWSARGLGWNQFPPNQKWFAISETLAHLDYLRHKGLVVQKQEGTLLTYFPVEP